MRHSLIPVLLVACSSSANPKLEVIDGPAVRTHDGAVQIEFAREPRLETPPDSEAGGVIAKSMT